MFNRVVSIAFLCVMGSASSLGQTRDTDAQTLHDILAELRAIHEDMRVTQTTQLLVAELQMQQGVVNRDTENADNARAKLNDIHIDQKQIGAELDHATEQRDKAATADERDAITHEIDRHKSNLAALKSAERNWSTTLQDMEQRLRNAEDKLDGIESELASAVSRLGPTSKDATQK